MLRGFPGGASGKEHETRDVGSILESGRYPGRGNGKVFSILAWRFPRTGEPGRLQSIASQRVRHN